MRKIAAENREKNMLESMKDKVDDTCTKKLEKQPTGFMIDG